MIYRNKQKGVMKMKYIIDLKIKQDRREMNN